MLKNKKILYTAVGICVILSGIFYYIGDPEKMPVLYIITKSRRKQNLSRWCQIKNRILPVRFVYMYADM